MQHNIAELTQTLLGALDSNYNVTNIATVTDVVTLLENAAVSKELLEATRLGKHINELRKVVNDELLAKRAKLLVKRWRNMLNMADANGLPESRKRPTSIAHLPSKKPRANGGGETYDLFSDNSNSSTKDMLTTLPAAIVVSSSDSNPAPPTPSGDTPKKRGRKKGSKNHKNLIEEAETSFLNKMAVSRGNAKVKTTQQLVVGLQQRISSVAAKSSNDDWRERAAKLTERVSVIDQKLNTGGARNKKKVNHVNSTLMISQRHSSDEDDIVIVDDDERTQSPVEGADVASGDVFVPSLSVEEALSRLPKIVVNDDEGDDVQCVCDGEAEVLCPAKANLEEKYRLSAATDERVDLLHAQHVDELNGNVGVDGRLQPSVGEVDGGDVVARCSDQLNIVPNFYELPAKQACSENFKKYSISEVGGGEGERVKTFREFHECLDRLSFNGETLRILPYVVID